MIDRDAFVDRGRERWTRLEELLARSPDGPEAWSELARLYRDTCADLAKAQSGGLPADIVRYLDQITGRAHNALYSGTRPMERSTTDLVFVDIPREIRRQWIAVVLSGALFYGPLLLGFVGSLLDTSFALAVLPESQLQAMEEMYSSTDVRGASEDPAMAGFYVYNNVGIAFRCFATGIFAGLGSLFYLVYNGLVLGTVGGYLTAVGRGGNLLNFTAGHSAWELNGIVLAGAAGLRMGWALVYTEGRTRTGSLRQVTPVLFRLISGAAFMLLLAALIEGFWSASPLPPPVKWAFGLLQCAIVALWWVLSGRGGAR